MLYFLKSYEVPLSYRTKIRSINQTKKDFITGRYIGIFSEIEWLKKHNCKIKIVMKIIPSNYFDDYRRTKYYVDLTPLNATKTLWFLLTFSGTRKEE